MTFCALYHEKVAYKPFERKDNKGKINTSSEVTPLPNFEYAPLGYPNCTQGVESTDHMVDCQQA